MKLEFEYGQGLLGAELPDSTDIFIKASVGFLSPPTKLLTATRILS